MDATADELAGVVDLFGGLTRAELERALSEVAFRDDGRSLDESAFASALDDAVESFAIVRDDRSEAALYVAGPTAFPSTPEHAEDLPHILDVDHRTPDRGRLGHAVTDRFDAAVTAALANEDAERARDLLDVSYDVEAWAPVELADQRARLDDLLD